MRTATFEVPTQVIGQFAARLGATNLDNQINGTTQDNDIEIEVFFNKDESDLVDDLKEHLADLIESMPEEEEED